MRWAMILIFLSLPSAAQEGKDDVHGSFFKKSDIDFWGTGEKKKADSAPRKKTAGGNDLYETIFAEPVQMPNGRYAVYVPPRAVLEFLENPTRDSARSYLDWQVARSRKIATALELLDTVKREGVEPPDGPTPDKKAEYRGEIASLPSLKAAHRRIRLTYFRQAG